MKETVPRVNLRSSRDLRGPVLGLVRRGTGERIMLPARSPRCSRATDVLWLRDLRDACALAERAAEGALVGLEHRVASRHNAVTVTEASRRAMALTMVDAPAEVPTMLEPEVTKKGEAVGTATRQDSSRR